MFPWLLRKPVSYFGSGVEATGRSLCQELSGIWEFLKGGSARSEGTLKCFQPSTHWISVSTLLSRGARPRMGALSARKAVACIPQHPRPVGDVGEGGSSAVGRVVGPSSWFLAVIKRIRNQACTARSHPLLLQRRSCGSGEGSGWEAGSG